MHEPDEEPGGGRGSPPPYHHRGIRIRYDPPRLARSGLLLLASLIAAHASSRADALDDVRAAGVLLYGTDTEGGAPFIYADPNDPARWIGFEVELMDRLGKELGVPARHYQGSWDQLLQLLRTGRVPVICNGYELTEQRAREYLPSRPYFVYQLQLMGAAGTPLIGWDDFRKPRPDGRPWRVGVLTNSVADRYLHEMARFYEMLAGRATIVPERRDSVVDSLREVQNHQLDATLQDDIAARYYLSQPQYDDLLAVGPPQGGGYYVLYLRPGDEALRDALDQGLARLIESGELRRIYERYGLWSPVQESLASWKRPATASTGGGPSWSEVLRFNAPFLRDAAINTIILSCASMPLAMLIGLFVAIGRRYGPWPLRWLLTGYVELIRGTPLLLQLLFLYFLLPRATGIVLDNLVTGILGLALNYSAYEAEIYRTGLQAVPGGQMEAAEALGMSRGTALWRIVVPQAVRIVIPPVTSDFITLLKDSSICSVIGLVELSKQYSISVNTYGHVVMFAALVAAIYLLMSLPLSRLAHVLERRLDAGLDTGRSS